MKNIRNFKCKNCNANLSLDENLKTLTCPYCGSVRYFDEKKDPTIQLYNEKLIVEDSVNERIPPRPTINLFVATLLFLSYVFPGIIYLIIVIQQQIAWDKKYNK